MLASICAWPSTVLGGNSSAEIIGVARCCELAKMFDTNIAASGAAGEVQLELGVVIARLVVEEKLSQELGRESVAVRLPEVNQVWLGG